jgi:hypothetical protein
LTGHPLTPSSGGLHINLAMEGDSKPITMDLGTSKMIYENKFWRQGDSFLGRFLFYRKAYFIVKDGDTQYHVDPQLIERNRVLEAENHLLKFKVNALLDMVGFTRFLF